MKKKKALFVAHQLNIGGAQKSLINALNAVDYSAFEVTLYIRNNRTDLLDRVNKNVSRIIINDDRTKYYRKPAAAALELMIWLRRLFRMDTGALLQKQSSVIAAYKQKYEYRRFFRNSEKYDVAVSYIQGYTAKFVADCIDAERKIMFFHTGTDDHHALHVRVMAAYDKIVAVSDGALEALKSFYPQYKDKMLCLKNHIAAEEIRKLSLAYTPDIPAGRLMLCTCGRFAAEKGFDLAVKAASMLKASGMDFCWYFVGDGPERQRIERMTAEHGVEENIMITGMLDNPYPYLRACDIYVQPSYEESFSLTLLEAQILNKPAVSSKTIGGQTLIRDGINGLLSPIDAGSLAETIMRLTRDNDMKERIIRYLSAVDYSSSEADYKKAWTDLLQ